MFSFFLRIPCFQGIYPDLIALNCCVTSVTNGILFSLLARIISFINKRTKELTFLLFLVKPSPPVGPVEFSEIQKTSVVITWKPSENDGGSPLTGYYIEMREAPKSSWQRVTTVNPDVTSYCVQNLKEKKDYFFKIYAENKVGRSDALASDGVTIKSPFGKHFIFSFFQFSLFLSVFLPTKARTVFIGMSRLNIF